MNQSEGSSYNISQKGSRQCGLVKQDLSENISVRGPVKVNQSKGTSQKGPVRKDQSVNIT